MVSRSVTFRVVLGFLVSFFALAPYSHAQLLDKAGIAGNDVRPTDVIIFEPVGPAELKDGKILIGLRLTTKENFSIYATNLKFEGPAGWSAIDLKAPKTVRIKDPVKGEEVEVFGPGDFEITFSGLDTWTADQFPLSITFLGCTERICLFPYTQIFPMAVVKSGEPAPKEASLAPPKGKPDTLAEQKPEGDDLGQQLAKTFGTGALPLWLAFLIVFAGGLLTNLTPCVAPLFPITARILANRPGSATMHAISYALGIVASYAMLGLIVVFTGGFFGALMANPYFNLVYAVLFFLLAFAMLGFIDLSKLQNIGARIGNSGQGPFSTFMMGTGAGLVAAPCTGPVFGALLAYSANNPQQPTANALLVVCYALGFGLPYVFIGIAFKKISKMRVNNLIQNTVKIVFSAVILGLAFYYLRIPLYKMSMLLKPYWGAIAGSTGVVGLISLVTTVQIWRTKDAKKLAIIPTLALGIALFALSQQLTSGSESGTKTAISWNRVEADAFANAKSSGRPLLIDNWAEWCEACKKMDATGFHDPAIVAEVGEHWVPLKLDLTLDDDKADVIKEKFKLSGLPTLVLLPPDGDLSKMKKIVGETSAASLLEAMRDFRGK